jgi:ankyrin repeat protein
MTPLQLALSEGCYNARCNNSSTIVVLLLELRADPNVPDASGRPPILTAINSKSTQLVQLLLDHNADPNAKTTRMRFSSAEHTFLSRNYEMAQLLPKNGGRIDDRAAEIMEVLRSDRKLTDLLKKQYEREYEKDDARKDEVLQGKSETLRSLW